MKRSTLIILMVSLVAGILHVSCATPKTKSTSTDVQFLSQPRTYTIKELKITVYGSPDQYPSEQMRRIETLGYTNGFDKHIHVLGERHELTYQTIVAWEVLGHEIMHVLNSYNLDVADPDQPGTYCYTYGTCYDGE